MRTGPTALSLAFFLCSSAAFAQSAMPPYGATGSFGTGGIANGVTGQRYQPTFTVGPNQAQQNNNQAGSTSGQSDYQRVMNSVNNSSGTAFGQPQPDPNAVNDTGNPAPNADTPAATPGTNTGPDFTASAAGGGGLPAATAFNGGTQVNGRGAPGYSNFNNSVGLQTVTGSPGLGAYNASPYNTAPASSAGMVGNGGNPQTPQFTGQP